MDSALVELLIVTFIAATIADLSMALGVLPFFFVRNISESLSGAFSAGAAGMMAAASLVQLTGEGLDRAPGWEAWEVAAGLGLGAAFYILVAQWVRRHEGFDLFKLRKAGGARALMIVAAMTVHSLPEGIAIGVAFGSQDQGLGISIVSALAVHNVPEAIAITLALRAAGVSPWMCLWWALFTSLPQPMAAPFAAWLIWLSEPLLPAGLGFAAGAMTVLVVDDLIPEALENTSRTRTAVSFMIGVIAMIALGRAVGL